MARWYPPHFQGVVYNGAKVGIDGAEVLEVDLPALEAEGWSPIPTVTTTIADVAAIAVAEDEES